LHYLAMPAVAVALDASVAIVENVPEVVRDKHSVVKKAVALFESNGYHVTDAGPLNAFKCGVAQTRKRHFLIATKYKNPDVMAVINGLVPAELTVWDAIGDLAELSGVLDAFDAPSRLSQENEKRVAWLHDNDARDLPNELRPDCHKNGHTYPSIYGRLDRDKPSPTVTGGFLSPGRGRYVHPSLPRALTPHEGARLQGFPDDFSFVDRDGMELSKKNYSKMIGNAVPPPLAFIVGLAALFNFTR
jgi:DNA (cytosine-5)-methyltransferase 1